MWLKVLPGTVPYIPLAKQGDDYDPDMSRAWPLAVNGKSSPTSDQVWMASIFQGPFHREMVDDDTFRVTSVSGTPGGSIDFRCWTKSDPDPMTFP